MGAMLAADAVRQARQVSEDVLFRFAMDVDAASTVPPGHLDRLAAAGLYGLAGPAAYGGVDADMATLCDVIEIMAAGCLATTFVWLQHHGVVRAVAASGSEELREAWLRPLCQGQRRAGVALGGARPGPPLLRASPVPGGFLLDGTSPWVTGWGMIDVVHTLARADAGQLVSALLPAVASKTLAAARLDLVAVNASGTVELSFRRHFVPADAVTGIGSHADWLARDARGLRPNGSLSLGVAARCCTLIGPSPLDGELARLRTRLDTAGADPMPAGAEAGPLPAARAAASEFAFRAAGAAVVAAGSRAILTGQHPQRLAREALFLLVFGSRPPIKSGLAGLLARH
jgi:alkylation response protein AidB-like acyl-CoA dehydrogenase